MLSTKKITIEAKTIVEGKEIHGHRAILSDDGVSMLPFQIDKAACKEQRAIVRADQAEFEDYAYDMQEKLFEKGEE